jgi:hypothetical protein
MAVKNWTDGDYVDASDLDGLTKSMNLTFATAAARDAFLVGDLAPQQGMIAHTLDTGITWHRITVGGTSYWAPAPGTMVCHVWQTSQTSIGTNGTLTQVTAMNTAASPGIRILNNWWVPDKFTPLCPGHYEINYCVAIVGAYSDSYRMAGVMFNTLTAFAHGSACSFLPGMASPNNVLSKSYPIYFNGTTDWAAIGVQSGSPNNHYTQSAAQGGGDRTGVNIKYLGP